MSYIIWLLFIAIGIIKSNSRLVNAIQKTWVVIMWGMANEIADIAEYRMHFFVSQLDWSPEYVFLKEGIYRNLCYFFRTIGFGVDLYMIVLAVFCVLAIDSTLNYYKIEQKGFVWSALMIFPMNELNVVLQGRLAFCVVLLGLRFLKENNVKNMILFGFHVVVAGCIHTGAYEFLVLYVVYFLKDKKRAFTIISAGIVAELVFATSIKSLIYKFNVEGFRAIDIYFEDSGSYVRTIAHIVLYIAVMTLVTYGYRSVEKNKHIELLHKIMWAMMLGYPLIILSTQFRRNLEIMFIIPYMCAAYNAEKMYEMSNKIFIKINILIMALVIYLGLHIRNFAQFQLNYVQYVINGNYIVQGIKLEWRLLAMFGIFIFMLVFTERHFPFRRFAFVNR